MTIDKIKDETLQYNINREAGKIELSPGKIYKYVFLTVEFLTI